MKDLRMKVIQAIESDKDIQIQLNREYGIDVNYIKTCDINELMDTSNKHSLGVVCERVVGVLIDAA